MVHQHPRPYHFIQSSCRSTRNFPLLLTPRLSRSSAGSRRPLGEGLDEQTYPSGAITNSSSPPSRAGPSAARSRTPAASSSSTSSRPSMSARTSPWTSRSAAKPSTRNPTSSNKSPTATPGGRGADSFIAMLCERLILMRDFMMIGFGDLMTSFLIASHVDRGAQSAN